MTDVDMYPATSCICHFRWRSARYSCARTTWLRTLLELRKALVPSLPSSFDCRDAAGTRPEHISMATLGQISRIKPFGTPAGSQRPFRRVEQRSRIAAETPTGPEIIVDAPPRPAGTCKTCGVPLKEIPWGCNQEGRVAGGIGAVVGFEWWPIKAYKPCGKAVKAGVLYTRKGQITDEMLFGRRKDSN